MSPPRKRRRTQPSQGVSGKMGQMEWDGEAFDRKKVVKRDIPEEEAKLGPGRKKTEFDVDGEPKVIIACHNCRAKKLKWVFALFSIHKLFADNSGVMELDRDAIIVVDGTTTSAHTMKSWSVGVQVWRVKKGYQMLLLKPLMLERVKQHQKRLVRG
jgi:hypothetical protein